MRNLLSKSAGLIMMLITLNVTASEMDPVIKHLDKSEMSVRIMMEDLNDGSEISIKDFDGIVYYREAIETSHLAKNFSFTNLDEGDYFIEVSSIHLTKKIPFTIERNEVVFSKNEASKTYRPLVTKYDSVVTIHKHNLNSKDLEINLYDSESVLLYSNTIDTTKKNGIKLNLAKLDKGQYKILLNTNNVTFQEFINLN